MKLILALFFLYITVFAQQIIIDENFNDWQSIPDAYIDPSGDSSGNIDFGTLKIYNDNLYIYFLIEVGNEINLQENNDITLYIDTDNNPATGNSINGIGAELKFVFGNRSGTYYNSAGGSSTIYHQEIGYFSAPTVTSDKFEFVLSRDKSIDGELVFPSETISVAIISSQDKLPDENTGVVYNFKSSNYTEISYRIEKSSADQVRILTYNVERDNLFDQSRKDSFGRILKAVKPDIIGFEEIYDHTSQQTLDLIAEFLPDENWYHTKSGSDIIYIGKYPVINSYSIDGNTAFYLDMTDKEKKMLFIAAHTPCCSNNDQRQKEIDHFMSFIRDAKEGTGTLQLEENSPIVIVGDMNLVGYSQQQKTLLTGEIINTNLYGPAFNPDWDGYALADAKPLTTGKPGTFTWYDEGSPYSPGRLDYIVYTSSVMKIMNSFALFTPAMHPDSLVKYNLEQNDVLNSADHLPTVADFSINTSTGIKETKKSIYNYKLFQNYPNPFNPTTTITFYNAKESNIKIELYDVLGNKIGTIENNNFKSGSHKIKLDASHLSSGIYFVRLSAEKFKTSIKIILIK